MRIVDAEPNPKSESPDQLTYQVTFWQRYARAGEVPPEDGPFRSYIWQLADTDVKEVIAWAEARAEPYQTYQIHVAVVDIDAGVNMLCLYGICPVESYYP